MIADSAVILNRQIRCRRKNLMLAVGDRLGHSLCAREEMGNIQCRGHFGGESQPPVKEPGNCTRNKNRSKPHCKRAMPELGFPKPVKSRGNATGDEGIRREDQQGPSKSAKAELR